MDDRSARGAVGLFGKLPARGDFVRAGLPGDFVAAWDGWLQHVIADSRARMGADWLPAFLEAPVWRFALAPGLCGAAAASGLWLPSVDRVGRYFPLTLAAMLPMAAADWLDAAEAAGRAALETDATPEEVLRRLPGVAAAPGAVAPAGSLWWTAGGPRVAAGRLALPGMPDADAFVTMLSTQSAETAEAGT